MESLKDIAERQQRNRPTYFEDPQKDHMLAMILELAEEVCVLRSRVETCQLLSGQGLACTDEAVDQFQPGDELQDQRLAQYTGYFEQLMKKLANDGNKNAD